MYSKEVREAERKELCMIMELPTPEAPRVFAAKIRQRSKLMAVSSKFGPALMPKKITMFMQQLSEAIEAVELQPFDPMGVHEFPDILHLAILSTWKGSRPVRDAVTSEILLCGGSVTYLHSSWLRDEYTLRRDH